MNLLNTIIFMSLFWILFSQLNQMRNAEEGCCKDKTCGKSGFDQLMWGITLTIAILLTLFLVYKIGYLYYKVRGKGSNLFKQTLAKQGTELLFGN